jgi:DNA modification methylase
MIDVSQSGHHVGDCRALLREMPDVCVQTCVTSPPYWGLRDYGVDGQLGLETTPEEYVANMVVVFSELRRVLRDDGTLWLNLGDCYAGGGRGGWMGDKSTLEGSTKHQAQVSVARGSVKPAGFHEYVRQAGGTSRRWKKPPPGYKDKDLVGIPWMVAFALRADGWWLRSDVIWAKPNPMPEPVADRPTKSHEYLFLLSKSADYFYDADAIREPLRPKTLTTFDTERRPRGGGDLVKSENWTRDVRRRRAKVDADGKPVGANKRTVWTVAGGRYDGAHFATYPPDLIEPCVLAGSRVGDIVLDPFFGSGTTGEVAEKHGRRWIGFDINPAYEQLQKERTAQRSFVLGGDRVR